VSEKLHDAVSDEEWRTMRHFFMKADWRNQQHYPSSDACPDLLAWEFLRRNAEFYREYAELAKVSDGFCVCLDQVEALGKKWKLDSIDPLIGAWPAFVHAPCSFASPWLSVDSVAIERLPSGGWRRAYEDKKDIVVLQFDLQLPISQQIKNAERLLASLVDKTKPSKVSNSKKKFPLYLRAYDGFKATRSYDMVADVLSKEGVQHDDFDYVQGVRNWVTAAEKLIQSDYWEIPFQFGAEWSVKQRELLPEDFDCGKSNVQ
jgi:hypothetical protein